jgi:hypothetical protein
MKRALQFLQQALSYGQRAKCKDLTAVVLSSFVQAGGTGSDSLSL